MSRLTRFVMVPTNPFMAGACVLGSVVAAQTAYLQVLLSPRAYLVRCHQHPPETVGAPYVPRV